MIPWDEFWTGLLQIGIGGVVLCLLALAVIVAVIYLEERHW